MENLRVVLNKIVSCIEMQHGATESQLKDICNDISSSIDEIEEKSHEIKDVYVFQVEDENVFLPTPVKIWNKAKELNGVDFTLWYKRNVRQFMVSNIRTRLLESVEEIDSNGLECGIEDAEITDRYNAMQYGFDKCQERAIESLEVELNEMSIESAKELKELK